MEYTINLRPINKGKLLAAADVKFENQFKLNGVKVFAGKEEGTIFTQMPSYQKLDPVTGIRGYMPVVVLSKGLNERVRNSIQEMFDKTVFNISSNPSYLSRENQRVLDVLVKNVTPFTNDVNNPNLRGFANIAISELGSENKIHINSIRIIEAVNQESGQNYLAVSMPRAKVAEKGGTFAYSDQCHSITTDLRIAIHQGVISEYKQKIGDYTIEDGLNEGKTNTERNFNEQTLNHEVEQDLNIDAHAEMEIIE